jgi:hypothetical protein
MSTYVTPTAALEASETAGVRDLRMGYRQYRPSHVTIVLGLALFAALAYLFVSGFWLRVGSVVDLIFVAAVGVLALLGFVLSLITSRPARWPRAVDVLLAIAAAVFAQFLTRDMRIPVLVAMGITGCVLGVAALRGGPLDFMSSAAGYTGMFTGLLQPGPTLPWGWVVAAGALAGVLFSVIGPAVLPGVGARMGAVAFLAGSVVYVVAEWMGATAPPILPGDATGFMNGAMLPVGMAGALVTCVLTRRTTMPFVLASALPSLIVCGVMSIALPGSVPVLGAAWVGGTLIASAAPARLPTAFWVGLTGIVYATLMMHFGGPLNGHVGVLGATATIACLAIGATEWLVHTHSVGALVARVAPSSATPQR